MALFCTSSEKKEQEQIILVDPQDRELGYSDKLSAHQQGLLHRAFSIFIFDPSHQLILLQQRQLDKYHSGGLWTNACCSHPRRGETLEFASQKRLREELNFTVPLTYRGHFIYRAEFDNGLIEHELDHVFLGIYDPALSIQANPMEVAQTQWITLQELQSSLTNSPEKFTPWLEKALALTIS